MTTNITDPPLSRKRHTPTPYSTKYGGAVRQLQLDSIHTHTAFTLDGTDTNRPAATAAAAAAVVAAAAASAFAAVFALVCPHPRASPCGGFYITQAGDVLQPPANVKSEMTIFTNSFLFFIWAFTQVFSPSLFCRTVATSTISQASQ